MKENKNNIQKKYSKILQKSYRAEFIDKIKQDVRKKIKNMTEMEIEFFANNVYDYCCFEVHHISEKERAEYMVYTNNKYYEELGEIHQFSGEISYQFCKNIKNKYLKILKARSKEETTDKS